MLRPYSSGAKRFVLRIDLLAVDNIRPFRSISVLFVGIADRLKKNNFLELINNNSIQTISIRFTVFHIFHIVP